MCKANEKRNKFYFECIQAVLSGNLKVLIEVIAESAEEIADLEEETGTGLAIDGFTRVEAVKEKLRYAEQWGNEYMGPEYKDVDRVERVVLNNGGARRSSVIQNAERNSGKTTKYGKLLRRACAAYQMSDKYEHALDVAEIFLDRLEEVHSVPFDKEVTAKKDWMDKEIDEMSDKELVELYKELRKRVGK